MLRSFLKIKYKVEFSWDVQREKHVSQSLGIIGAPISKGQTNPGVANGPSAIRKWGLVSELKKIGLSVKDYGDLEIDDIKDDEPIYKVKYPLNIGSACRKLSNAVKEVLESNRRCLTLGGDHSIAIGTIHGHSQVHDDVCVLWVDAHSDINTEATTPSGNIHGMSCSFLIKELKKYKIQLPGFEWLSPSVHKTCIAYIGLRDIDPSEKLILDKEKIVHYSMKDVDRLGIVEVTNRALDAINPSGKRSLHLSFDIDSIDASIAPSTGTPVLGGLTLREALTLAEELSNISALNAVDLVEVNPHIGKQEQIENTLAIAVLVIKTIFGFSRAGIYPVDLKSIPVLYK